jgi:hypothetical protein
MVRVCSWKTRSEREIGGSFCSALRHRLGPCVRIIRCCSKQELSTFCPPRRPDACWSDQSSGCSRRGQIVPIRRARINRRQAPVLPPASRSCARVAHPARHQRLAHRCGKSCPFSRRDPLCHWWPNSPKFPPLLQGTVFKPCCAACPALVVGMIRGRLILQERVACTCGSSCRNKAQGRTCHLFQNPHAGVAGIMQNVY